MIMQCHFVTAERLSCTRLNELISFYFDNQCISYIDTLPVVYDFTVYFNRIYFHYSLPVKKIITGISF